MTSPSLTEEQLVAALRAGQEAAFTTFYDAYSSTLLGVILRLVKDPELAQDLLQDTFVKIWTHRQGYDGGQGRLFTWLVRIANNVALDQLRKQDVRAQAKVYSLDETRASDDFVFLEDVLLGSVFSLIPAKYRQIIELVYARQFTQQEIAQELDLPLGTVKTRIRTALRDLKLVFHQDIAYYQAR